MNLVGPCDDDVAEIPERVVPLGAGALVEVGEIGVGLFPYLHLAAGEAVVRKVQRGGEARIVLRIERGHMLVEHGHRGGDVGIVGRRSG